MVLVTMLGAGCQPGAWPLSSSGPAAVHPAPSTVHRAPAAPQSNPPKSASPSRSLKHPATRFCDVTEKTGITFVHCSGNSPEKLYSTANTSGVAMLDYDGDGWLDLYFATTRNLPLNTPPRFFASAWCLP
jgi:enediyne biosynthesis protein E4